MSLHAKLRDTDRSRATRALTAWYANDKAALDLVLGETSQDPSGAAGLVLALLDHCDWLSRNTGSLTGDQDQA